MAKEITSYRFDNETLFKLEELTNYYKKKDKKTNKSKVLSSIIADAYDNINSIQKNDFSNNELEKTNREIIELEYTIIKLLTAKRKRKYVEQYYGNISGNPLSGPDAEVLLETW